MRDEHLAGTVDGELDGHDALDDDVLDRLHQLGRVDVVRLEVLQVRAEMLWLFLINVRPFFLFMRGCSLQLLRLFFVLVTVALVFVIELKGSVTEKLLKMGDNKNKNMGS